MRHHVLDHRMFTARHTANDQTTYNAADVCGVGDQCPLVSLASRLLVRAEALQRGDGAWVFGSLQERSGTVALGRGPAVRH
jgi:hypothetical protein